MFTFFLDILGFGKLWNWLTEPSASIWAGMLSAAIAAFLATVSRRLLEDYRGRTRFCPPNPILVGLIWVVLVSSIDYSMDRFGKSEGRSPLNVISQEKESAGNPPEEPPQPTVTRETIINPPGGYDLRVSFEQRKETETTPFSCRLIISDGKGQASQIEIHANNMENFRNKMRQELQNVNIVAPPAKVHINNSPAPSQQNLDIVAGIIQDSLGTCHIEVGADK